MKKFLAFFLLVLIVVLSIPCSVSAETYVPSRTINLVFDDSGSMIKLWPNATRSTYEYVDTWCQAKYALEVVAAMLGKNDTLNVYYMSDYVYNMSAPPKLSLKGSADASVTAKNVASIHNLVTDCSGTPFDSVRKAYSDLKTANTDEKWLVVLTDGEFEKTSTQQVEAFFDECVSDGKTKVMMLSMGPDAAFITPNEAKNIYFSHAETTKEILPDLTKMCNQIFQNNSLPFDAASLTTEFNVPMSELIVFAQGKNVEIKGIEKADGTLVKPSSNVKVMYSETATTDKSYSKSQVVVADDLIGYVATFSNDFDPGRYSFNIEGADEIEVYYKPNVSIAAFLYSGNREVTAEDNLIAGSYRIEFGFINAKTGEKVYDTSLLGDIDFSAEIINTTTAGDRLSFSATSGGMVTIREGDLEINAKARFLEYNTVSTSLKYKVFMNAGMNIETGGIPLYYLTSNGILNSDKPFGLHIVVSNEDDEWVELNEQQWRELKVTDISSDGEIVDFRVEKTSVPGSFDIYLPEDAHNDPRFCGRVDFSITCSYTIGLSSAAGTMEMTVPILYPEITPGSATVYQLTGSGITNINDPTLLTVKYTDGTDTYDVDANIWSDMDELFVSTEDNVGPFRIEKTGEAGVYHIYPSLYNDDPFSTATGEIHYKATYNHPKGDAEGTIQIVNNITATERFMHWLKDNWLKATITLLAVVLILGYMPGIKKYFSKKIQSRPYISCSANRIGVKDQDAHGKFQKNIMSTLIPYIPETATITFSASPNKKTAQLKAGSGKKLLITNYKKFAGKEEYSFGNKTVDKDCTKPIMMSPSQTIVYNTTDYTYTCYPTRQK